MLLRSHLALFVLAALFAAPLAAKGPRYTDPKKADKDYADQGEYAGEVSTPDGKKEKVGVQVIALGKGKFRAVAYPGGLPRSRLDQKSRRYQRRRPARGRSD